MGNVILVKEKIENMPDGFVIPMHPEIVFTEEVSLDCWKAKDNDTGESVVVTKTIKGKFCEYEVDRKIY